MLERVRSAAGALIQGVGPAHLQADRARATRRALVANQPSANELDGQTRRLTTADTATPQVFINHPRLQDALDPTVLGADAFPHLPGRFPAPGWDGENDSRAPEWTR